MVPRGRCSRLPPGASIVAAQIVGAPARRSFELNYENNILFYDRDLTAEVRRRQDSYIARSHPVTPEMVAAWPWQRRLWNYTIAMIGPVL